MLEPHKSILEKLDKLSKHLDERATKADYYRTILFFVACMSWVLALIFIFFI